MASPGPGLPSREPLFQRTAETLGKHSSAEQEGGDLRQYTPAANTAIHDNLQQWTGPERCGAVRERVARRRARFRETVARSHAADVVLRRSTGQRQAKGEGKGEGEGEGEKTLDSSSSSSSSLTFAVILTRLTTLHRQTSMGADADGDGWVLVSDEERHDIGLEEHTDIFFTKVTDDSLQALVSEAATALTDAIKAVTLTLGGWLFKTSGLESWTRHVPSPQEAHCPC
ncbi:hypothetical protein BC567DRAFT_213612 [Phyllosticta citribraziliensis]